MEFEHKPVLLDECIDYLNIRKDLIYIDGTLGGAGHSTEIAKSLSGRGKLIGIDQDEEAIKVSSKRLETFGDKVVIVRDNFSNISNILKDLNIAGVDGILLDIGVSSHQLDEEERGFSYMKDAPLDMRMDRSKDITAKDILNDSSFDYLKTIFKEYGEEKWADRIAKFIIEKRQTSPYETTLQLVDTIKAAIPLAARQEGGHPAKRTFQALRIAVNDELGVLSKVIEAGVNALNSGGRFAIITFQSLEDRIVKQAFNKMEKPCTCPPKMPMCICGKKPIIKILTRKPIISGETELTENTRAKSAKLRVIEKL